MSEIGWYNTDNCHAPVRRAAPADGKTAGKKRSYSPWVKLTCVLLALLLLVAGSSVLFSGTAPKGESIFDGKSGSKPGDWRDALKDYYTVVEKDTAEIKLPRLEKRPDMELELAEPGEEPLSLSELYTRCSPSIVGIKGFIEGKQGYNWGTAIVVTEDGLMLTNTHVIENCDRAVICIGEDEYEAKLVGADKISDLALLKIDAKGLTPAEFGRSDALVVGEAVAAIGNPLSEEYRQTLTDGIISAINRGMSYNGHSMTLLQTNTAINEGNSGGALFNMYGQVVGVTNMKMMSAYSSIEGIGFAIPSDTIRSVCNALLKDGAVKGRPALGITVGAIPEEFSKENGIPEGLYVTAVSQGSDAEKQGIKAGDILTEVNGKSVRSTQDVLDIKNALNVGDSLHMKLWRNGETLEFDVKLNDTNDIYK